MFLLFLTFTEINSLEKCIRIKLCANSVFKIVKIELQQFKPPDTDYVDPSSY